MRETIEYWKSVFHEAVRAAIRGAIGSGGRVAREVIVLGVAFWFAIVLFGESGIQIASDEMRFGLAIICGLVVVFVVEAAIRFVSIPAIREADLKRRIEELCPEYPTLTTRQTEVLCACDPSIEDHWIDCGRTTAVIDGKEIENIQTTATFGNLEFLCRHEIAEFTRHNPAGESIFVLTNLGCRLRDKLCVSEAIGGE